MLWAIESTWLVWFFWDQLCCRIHWQKCWHHAIFSCRSETCGQYFHKQLQKSIRSLYRKFHCSCFVRCWGYTLFEKQIACANSMPSLSKCVRELHMMSYEVPSIFRNESCQFVNEKSSRTFLDAGWFFFISVFSYIPETIAFHPEEDWIWIVAFARTRWYFLLDFCVEDPLTEIHRKRKFCNCDKVSWKAFVVNYLVVCCMHHGNTHFC